MLKYLRLTSEGALPDIAHLRPYKSVVVVERSVTPDRQTAISKWLIDSGCLYMMAWGHKCSSWDDSVDIANLENFNYGEIPDSKFVMTTWHENEPLQKVFWYAKNAAFHPDVELANILIVHIGDTDKDEQYKEMYRNA